METRFVEATQGVDGGFNWGKFMVGRFTEDEWRRPSAVVEAYERSQEPRILTPEMDERRLRAFYFGSFPRPLLPSRGWDPAHVIVFDLETGEGAAFLPGGSPAADLAKHRVWVCPMFEPFLEWLYEHVRAGALCKGCKRPQREWGPVCGGMTQGDMTHFAGSWWDALPEVVELPDAPEAMAGYRREGPKPPELSSVEAQAVLDLMEADRAPGAPEYWEVPGLSGLHARLMTFVRAGGTL